MKSLKSNSGQGLIEYLLVLILVVSLVLGVIYQLNDAFKVWANSYFGNYLMCLMESGELPNLGAGQDPNSQCHGVRPRFSIDEGEALVGDGVSEGSGSDSDAGFTNNSGSATQRPSGNADAGSVGRGRSFANRTGTATRFRPRKNSGGGEDGDEESGISRESSGQTSGFSDGAINNEGKATRVAIRGSAEFRAKRKKQKEEEEKKKKTKVKNVEQENEQRAGPQLIKVSRKAASTDEAPEIDDMSFGGYLRYLIIAAIVIALVIFLGGQVLQVSKSME